jgi:hypothetical protein
MLFPSVLLLQLCRFIHYFLMSALLPHYRKSCKQHVPHYCLSKQASKLRCSVKGCAAPTVLRRKLFLSTSPIAKLCSILYCKSWYGSIVTGCLLCGLKLSRAARQHAIAETRLMARRRGYSAWKLKTNDGLTPSRTQTCAVMYVHTCMPCSRYPHKSIPNARAAKICKWTR